VGTARYLIFFWLSLLPIVRGWVGRYPLHALPAASYGVVGLGSAAAYWILAGRIIRANGDSSAIARAIGSDIEGNLSQISYAARAGSAFAAPVASYVMYGSVAVMWFVPDRRLASVTGSTKCGSPCVG